MAEDRAVVSQLADESPLKSAPSVPNSFPNLPSTISTSEGLTLDVFMRTIAVPGSGFGTFTVDVSTQSKFPPWPWTGLTQAEAPESLAASMVVGSWLDVPPKS